MVKSVMIAFVAAAATVGNMKLSSAEITSFNGFPTINVLQPGNPTFDSPTTSDFVTGLLRPNWTRAMSDVGAWPSLFQFQDDIFLEFSLVDGHRGTGGAPGATGAEVRYRSPDKGNTWELLDSSGFTEKVNAEYAVKGDTLYRYEYLASDHRTAVSTSTNGVTFTATQPVYESPYWLFGVIYDSASNKFYAPPHFLPPTVDESQRQVQLIESDDGIDWNYVATIHGIGNHESETAIHIQPDGSMVALVRQKWAARDYFMATSPGPPYTDWTSVQMNFSLEGQHFFEVDGQLFLGSRAFFDPALASAELISQNAELGQSRLPYTLIYKVESDFSLLPWAVLDSMGDNSYPEVVVTDDEVLIAYYSQHQDRVDKVYLAAFDKATFLKVHAPEPSTFVLAGMGFLPLYLLWRKRRTRSTR
jgi:hypothetical protein